MPTGLIFLLLFCIFTTKLLYEHWVNEIHPQKWIHIIYIDLNEKYSANLLILDLVQVLYSQVLNRLILWYSLQM